MATTKKVETQEQKPTIVVKEGESAKPAIRLEAMGLKDGELFTCTLSEIVEIKKLDIERAKDVQRPLVKANLESLYQADLSKVPPMEVQASSSGYILASGYHRFNMFQARALFDFHVANNTWPIDSRVNEPVLNLETLTSVLSDEDGKPRDYTPEESRAIDTYKVRVSAINMRNMNDLLRYIMRANTTHGAALNQSQRSKYAYLEYLMANEEHKKMSLREAARRYGISHVAVMDYRDSKTGKQDTAQRLTEQTGVKVEASDVVKGKVAAETVNGQASAVSTLTSEEVQKQRESEAAKVGKAFFKGMRDLYAGIKDGNADLSANYLRSFTTKADIEALNAMSDILSRVAKKVEADNAVTPSQGK